MKESDGWPTWVKIVSNNKAIFIDFRIGLQKVKEPFQIRLISLTHWFIKLTLAIQLNIRKKAYIHKLTKVWATFKAYFMDSQALFMNTTKTLKKNLEGLNMLQNVNHV